LASPSHIPGRAVWRMTTCVRPAWPRSLDTGTSMAFWLYLGSVPRARAFFPRLLGHHLSDTPHQAFGAATIPCAVQFHFGRPSCEPLCRSGRRSSVILMIPIGAPLDGAITPGSRGQLRGALTACSRSRPAPRSIALTLSLSLPRASESWSASSAAAAQPGGTKIQAVGPPAVPHRSPRERIPPRHCR